MLFTIVIVWCGVHSKKTHDFPVFMRVVHVMYKRKTVLPIRGVYVINTRSEKPGECP